MGRKTKIYWVDLNRFDSKPDKSTWLEMGDALFQNGYEVEILTGYGQSKYYPEGRNTRIRYFGSIERGGLFRISLLLHILGWLLRHMAARDICILSPNALFMAPFLRLFFKKNLHLDIRSVLVDIYSFKDKLDHVLYWKMSMRLFSPFTTGRSFITERLRLSVEEEFGKTDGRYVIWESGVNTDLFQSQSAYKNPSADFVLFYHGTITRNRGISRVVRALALLPVGCREHIRFVVVGAGSGAADLKEVAVEVGVERQTELRGLVPYEQIPGEIAQADCCICPLLARPEWDVSSPLKVFEYLASGKPIILTPIPAHKDVAAEQEYIVWTDGDSVEDFARAIESAYKNRERLALAAQQGPAFVREHYDWKSQGRKLANYLRATFKLA